MADRRSALVDLRLPAEAPELGHPGVGVRRDVAGQNTPRPKRRKQGAHQHERASAEREIIVLTRRTRYERSGCELIRHCANIETKTTATANNTTIRFRMLRDTDSPLARIGVLSLRVNDCLVARGRDVAGQNKPRPKRRKQGAHQHDRMSAEREIIVLTLQTAL